MSDLNASCQNYYPPMINSESEPQPIIFKNIDCKGAQTSLTVSSEETTYDLRPMGFNDSLDVVAVPPNMTMWLAQNSPPNYGHTITVGPGGLHNLNDTVLGNDSATTIKVNRVQAWNDHLVDCCTNKGTQANCGQFWGGSNTGACDPIMRGYCNLSANQKSDICSCFHPIDSNGNTIPQPQCFYNTCISGGYQTKNMTDNTSCGTYCSQIYNMGGNTNTAISNQALTQYCGTQTPHTITPETGSGGGTYTGPPSTSTPPSSPPTTPSTTPSTDESLNSLSGLLSQSVTIGGTQISYSTIGGGIVYILCYCCCCIIILFLLKKFI
ncbi:MAG: hypothetical protein Homavirus10_8 [Homavirus sp.]|uniref:Uncharacterized protein n=1 Tax=Homavirus sp. TaxID=2487769 RepID=A0A3G5A9X5_9VIRU|nr:MAG: hypothetical protein Homavirus10_8 [Homavirus sp.]